MRSASEIAPSIFCRMSASDACCCSQAPPQIRSSDSGGSTLIFLHLFSSLSSGISKFLLQAVFLASLLWNSIGLQLLCLTALITAGRAPPWICSACTSCPLLEFQGRQVALLRIELSGVLPVFSEGASLRALCGRSAVDLCLIASQDVLCVFQELYA